MNAIGQQNDTILVSQIARNVGTIERQVAFFGRFTYRRDRFCEIVCPRTSKICNEEEVHHVQKHVAFEILHQQTMMLPSIYWRKATTRPTLRS